MSVGPLQLMVVGFVDPALDGSVLGALEDASATGAIKVVDVLGVYKAEDGTVLAAEASDEPQTRKHQARPPPSTPIL